MAAIIKSVSLNREEDEFLQDYSLSPTQLLKEKIWEMQGMIRNVAQKKVQRQAEVIGKLYAKIEELENVIQKETKTDDGGEE